MYILPWMCGEWGVTETNYLHQASNSHFFPAVLVAS